MYFNEDRSIVKVTEILLEQPIESYQEKNWKQERMLPVGTESVQVTCIRKEIEFDYF